MSQDHLIKLKCDSCGRFNYWSRRNRKRSEKKVDNSKFCKFERKHTRHKEAKK